MLDPRLTDPGAVNLKSSAFDAFSETLRAERARLEQILHPDPWPEEEEEGRAGRLADEPEPEPEPEAEPDTEPEVAPLLPEAWKKVRRRFERHAQETLKWCSLPVAVEQVRLVARVARLELRQAELQVMLVPDHLLPMSRPSPAPSRLASTSSVTSMIAVSHRSLCQTLEAKLGGAAVVQCTVGVPNWAGAVSSTLPRPLVPGLVQWPAGGEEAAGGGEDSMKLLDHMGKEGLECFGDELRLKGAPTWLNLDLFADDGLAAAVTRHQPCSNPFAGTLCRVHGRVHGRVH